MLARVLDQQEAGIRFREASRPGLAEKEESEASLLATVTFLPPPLTADEVEWFLTEAVSLVIASYAQTGVYGDKTNIQMLVAKSLKAFWANVPPSHSGTIPSEELSRRARALIETNSVDTATP